MKKFLSVALILFLSSIFLLTGCSKEKTKSQEKVKIIAGFSQIGAESSWRTCNTQSMIKAADDAGIQLIFSDGEQKQANQIKAIRSFIVYQVDIIIFVPIVQDGWDNVLREAKEANIPVIVVDRKIKTEDPTLYTAYIGPKNFEEGINAAQFLIDKYKETNQKLNIVEFRGTEGSSVAQDRYNGFRSIINNEKKFNIIASLNGDFMRSKGKEIAESFTIKDEDDRKTVELNGQKVDIIFSHNDAMTLGAIDVLELNGVNCGQDITIVTIDGEQEAVNDLKNKMINCVIECNPKLGDATMELAHRILNGEDYPKETYISGQVFSEKDLPLNIEDRGY